MDDMSRHTLFPTSSVGSKVRLKRKLEFIVSGYDSSWNINRPHESYSTEMLPKVGPPSVIGEEDIREGRDMYSLPISVNLRVPRSGDRTSDFGVQEIAVYEAFLIQF
ncbi:hypothetical protein N665_0167s0008 [Sinapis alba]|nr:hypothetical protein N665_0167s0008 [Sinapis alba]